MSNPFLVLILYYHILDELNIYNKNSKEKNFNFLNEENNLGNFNILNILLNDYLLLLVDINQLRGIAVIKSNIKYVDKYFIIILYLS